MTKNANMLFNRKKIKGLDDEINELPPENTVYDPVEVEKKNLEILLMLEKFYERLLFLAKLFYVLGITFCLLCFTFLFICWRFSILFFGIAIWCLWIGRKKKSLSDCAPSFIRFVMLSDQQILAANKDPTYKIELPKAEDFI